MPSRRDPETGLAVRGTSNSNQRGSAESRRRRKAFLLETYPADRKAVRVTFSSASTCPTMLRGTTKTVFPTTPGLSRIKALYESLPYIETIEVLPTARCFHCGDLLTYETLTVDRIVPHCKGGTYRRNNIRPACLKHNSELGAALANGRAHASAKKRAAKKRVAPTAREQVA